MSSIAELEQEAESQYSCGDLQGALEKYRLLLEQRPGNPEILSRLGRICVELGQTSEGQQYYREALQAEPELRAQGRGAWAALGSAADRAALLSDLRAVRPERMLTSWREVLEVAGELVSHGDVRRAFRLVLEFRASEATEESARFLRERFLDAPLKFAIVMDEGIGNMVMLTPAIRAIRGLFPKSELEVVGKPPALQVLKGWELVQAVTLLEEFDSGKDRDAVLLSIWAGKIRSKHESAFVAAGLPILAVRYEGRERHEAEFHLDLARLLGFEGAMPEPHCATEEVPFPFVAGRPVALVSDTANPDPEWARKRWPHFRELAYGLAGMGFQVGLIGGPAEAEAFTPTSWPPGVVNLMGSYSIPQVAYLLKRADILVANDSGPAHLGAAVGTDTYVIFGPTLEGKNLPLGPRVHPIASDIGCRPCQYLQSWSECTRHRCMEGVSAAKVLEVLRRRDEPVPQPSVVTAAAPAAADHAEVRVDLGCGLLKRKGYIGIDVDPHSSADIVCDVTRGIPLETDSVDYLVADNLLEHIGDGFIALMNEVWRVCKPTARVEIIVPVFPSNKAMSDPTHRRYFTPETFAYLDSSTTVWRSFSTSYGFKPFRIVSMRKLAGELEVILAPDKAYQSLQLPTGDGEKPRLCFLSHNQPGAGGGENAMHYVANRLVEGGYEVTVLYNEQPFIHSIPVSSPPDAQYRIGWVRGPNLAEFHKAAAQAVAERAAETDICFSLWKATSPSLMRACMERGVLAGIWCQDADYAPEWSNNSIFRMADFVVVVTPYSRPVLARHFGRTENVFVIPNAAGDAYFANYRERTRTEVRRFVFLGRLADDQKGLITLCDALGRVQQEGMDFSLDVIGTGPDLGLMKSRIGSLGMGEKVRFLGWKKAAEAAAILPDYDLATMPSNYEACSLAVAECMAAGVPVIATAVGGTPWLITDKKEGLLVPPRRPDLLAQAVKWACTHPLELNLMARWAHRKALKGFHWERVVRDYRRAFSSVYAAHVSRRQRLKAG
jgi:hypothetical protein